jgi:hypothetical protein
MEIQLQYVVYSKVTAKYSQLNGLNDFIVVADFARYRCRDITRMDLFAALETQPLQDQAQTVGTKVPGGIQTLLTHLASNYSTNPHSSLHFAKPAPHNPAHKASAPIQLLRSTRAVHSRQLLSLNFKTHLLLVN